MAADSYAGAVRQHAGPPGGHLPGTAVTGQARLWQRFLVARCGCGLMHLDDEAFDELLLAEVVRDLLQALCASMLAFLAAICPAPR